MRHLLLILLLSLSAILSASTPDDKSLWLGVCAGADQHFGLDLGIPCVRSGPASWGIHVGAVGLNRQTGTDQAQTPGTVRETDFNVLQIGGWSDWGRGYGALGAEHLQRSVTTYTGRGSQINNTDQMGAYLKLGYRIAEHISLYVSAGTQSKLLGGIGIHF